MKKNKGFTLIEILIALSLFVLVMAGITGIIAMILKNNKKAQDILLLRREGSEAVQKINRSLGGALQVESCSQYQVNYLNLAGESSAIYCDTENEELSIADSNIINDNVNIVDCLFTCIPLTNKYGFEFTLTLSTGTNSESFFTKVVMRNEQYED